MRPKQEIPAPRSYSLSRILARNAGRAVLAELLGDSFASMFLVMFPSMRWRRVVALWLSLFLVRAVLRRPVNRREPASSAV
jgi:hypothetical protein